MEDATLTNDVVTKMGKITIKLPFSAPANFDLNAASNLVEVTTKGNLMQIWLNEQTTTPTNLIIRNLTFQHAGESCPLLLQRQNNLLIEDCRFIKNKKVGLGVNPSLNTTLRRVECLEYGEFGAAISNVSDATIEQCQFNLNSRQGDVSGYTGWSVCGIKFLSFTALNKNITLYRCEALDNRSTGFWWDTGNYDCQMIECVSTGNIINGTFIEDNNSTANNYEEPGKGLVGTRGIPNLGNRHTIKALRYIFAGNRPALGTENYRTTKGRGVFFSEKENAILDGWVA